MVRRRRALITVVVGVLAVVGSAACQAPTVPIGTRAAGDNVEAFVGSCSGVAIDVELYETEVPVPTSTRPPRSGTGTSVDGGPSTRGTIWDRGTSVWEGTVPVDQTSIVIPVALDPGNTYTIRAHGAGDPHFDDHTFVPADLTADGVTPYGPWNPAVSPEAFAEHFDSACDRAAGPVRWILYAVFLAVILIIVAAVVGFVLLIRSATRRRPPTAPPPAWP